MADLLPRCLDSLLAKADVLGQLEAIVVNDGSKDDSLAVASKYQSQYPETVTVIDKPNGNYGSTINAALPIAKGKYIKILDSDDWFDSDALLKFMSELQNNDADMIVTHFTVVKANGKKEISRYNVYGKQPYEYGKVYPLDKVLGDGYIRFFLMHALTYRTEMLRAMGYRQTEGVSYTDLEWATYPVFAANSIIFFDTNLYQYNLGREGQTMDPKVMLRSISQLEKVTDRMIDFYVKYDKDSLSQEKLAFLSKYYLNRLRVICKCYLFDMPRRDFDAGHFSGIESDYQKICNQLNWGPIKLYPENKIVRFDAMKYWHRHGKRWPSWFEFFNSELNKISSYMYTLLFR